MDHIPCSKYHVCLHTKKKANSSEILLLMPSTKEYISAINLNYIQHYSAMLFSLFSSFHSLPLKIVDVDINIAWAAVRSCDYHLWLRPPDRVYQCLDTSPDSGLTTQIWETSECTQIVSKYVIQAETLADNSLLSTKSNILLCSLVKLRVFLFVRMSLSNLSCGL